MSDIKKSSTTDEFLTTAQRSVSARLSKLRRRLRCELAFELVAQAVAILVAVGAVLVAVDWMFRLELPARLTLLIGSLTAAATVLAVRQWTIWKAANVSDIALAQMLDRHRPGTGQHVADVLQLPRLLAEPTASVSRAMVRDAVQRASDALASSDWHRLWNRKRTVRFTGMLTATTAVVVAFAWLAPYAARLSLDRWLLGSTERWPQKTYLTVVGVDEDGAVIAARDEPFVLEVRADLPGLIEDQFGWILLGRGKPLTLDWDPAPPQLPDFVRVDYPSSDRELRTGVMNQIEPGRYRFEFPPAGESSEFLLGGGDDWLGPLTLQRVDRPHLESYRLRVREPGAEYTGMRDVEEGAPHLVFLPDTEIELTLAGGEPLAEMRLKINGADAPALDQLDETTFATKWTLTESTTLEVGMTSEVTHLTSKPFFLSIGLLKDREPRVALRANGVGVRVTPVAEIPLSIDATDDFGLAALRLELERTITLEGFDPQTQNETVKLELPADAAVLDHQAGHTLMLSANPPRTGTLLRVRAEAEDRCARGVQIGRSSTLQFQVVSADELFYDILIRQRAERARFAAMLDAVRKERRLLDGEPTTNQFLEVMRGQRTAARQLEQSADRISDILTEMKLNQIGAPKSHALLQESIIDPMRTLASGPMNELRSMLQSLANAADSPDVTEDSARRLHDQVANAMEGVLEQMAQWESFVDVVNQVAEVIRMQQGILNATEKARESRVREVFDDLP